MHSCKQTKTNVKQNPAQTEDSQFFCTKHKKISYQVCSWDSVWAWIQASEPLWPSLGISEWVSVCFGLWACEACLACGINHLTGSVASLVAPTTTAATTGHFSMRPLKDICLFVCLSAGSVWFWLFAFHERWSAAIANWNRNQLPKEPGQQTQLIIVVICGAWSWSWNWSSIIHLQQHPHHGSGAWLKPGLRKCPGWPRDHSTNML